MNINDTNKYNLIDKYLKGGMSSTELDSFKAFLQSDKDFATDLSIISELQEASTFNVVEQQLRETLNNVHRNTSSSGEPQQSVSQNGTWTKAAIVFAVMALLCYVMFRFVGPMTTQETTPEYQQYAMVEPLELTTKSESNGFDLASMQNFYNNAEYNKAIPLLNEFLAANPTDLDVLLAKGIALSETSRYTEAHKVFDHIKSLNPRVKKYLWYDAMTFLKAGDEASASAILKEVVTTKAYNNEKASAILESIK